MYTIQSHYGIHCMHATLWHCIPYIVVLILLCTDGIQHIIQKKISAYSSILLHFFNLHKAQISVREFMFEMK